jgi:hypothetical protein
MWSKAHRKIFCSLWFTRLQVPHCLSSPKYPLSEWKLESLMLLCEEHVEVVLRHFHRCRYWSSTAVVLLLEGHRSLRELVIREYGGHEGLRGSGRRSVTPYVHR